MKPLSENLAETDHLYSPVAKSPSVETDDPLRELLKRCPASTYQAARLYRQSGDPRHLPTIILGLLEKFVEPELRIKLRQPADTLCLAADLGIDSLSMMEIVILAEEVFAISIKNEELRSVRTLGDVKQFIAEKVRQPPQPHDT